MRCRLDWKLRRIAAGLRQQDVAGQLGVSGTRYSALERGEVTPKEWETEALEKLLPPVPQGTLRQTQVQLSAETRA
jgi:DNA-binding XRE family transcriptional regulator